MHQGDRRDFDKVAASWDDKPQRHQVADAVASGIAGDLDLNGELRAMEYGCGTGLCGLQLAPKIGHLTAVDSSSGMLQELARKSQALGLHNVTPVLVQPQTWTLPASAYDLVICSMVLHHIPDTLTLLNNFHRALRPAGALAIADLEQEDGTFHDDATGVDHHGFDPQALLVMLAQIGFNSLKTRTVHTIRKQRHQEEHCYPVFLITGRKTI
jgi:ubiquinone/menaquinone biosynthesis C-methylase UbiE